MSGAREQVARLLARGFSPQKTVLVIYTVAGILGAAAIFLAAH